MRTVLATLAPSLNPWIGACVVLAIMIVFSMHSLASQFTSMSRVTQGPQATTLALMARALGSRDAAGDLFEALQALPAEDSVFTVVDEENPDFSLLRFLVRYATWPRYFELIDCADRGKILPVPAHSAVVLTNIARASVEGEVHHINANVALVVVRTNAEPVTCL